MFQSMCNWRYRFFFFKYFSYFLLSCVELNKFIKHTENQLSEFICARREFIQDSVGKLHKHQPETLEEKS